MALSSPFVYTALDYRSRAISMSVTFEELTGLLVGAQITRDNDCMYSAIYWGVGGDGSPNAAAAQWKVGTGGLLDVLLTILLGELQLLGFLTISNMLSMQIAAGP